MPHRHHRPHFARNLPRYHSGRDSHFYLYSEPEVVHCYCDGEPCPCPPQDTGALNKIERQNPLPVGVYWIDIPKTANRGPFFLEWLRLNRDVVKVRKTVDDQPNMWDAMVGSSVMPAWFLFEVLPGRPVVWDIATKVGFPTHADNGVQTEKQDTVQRPEPEKDPLDKLSDAFDSLPTVTPMLLLGGVVIGGLYLFRKELFSNGVKRLRNLRPSGNRRAKG